jgi:peptidoglycan/xylan/chitin deacetylase (PgdA/CDA1 family)
MKNLMLATLAVLFSFASVFSFGLNAPKPSVPVLCYHHISNRMKNQYSVTPKVFERQIKYLYDNGFKTISPSLLVDYIKGIRVNMPSKPVLITFDDGLKSQYKYAYPILKKYSFTGIFFIYPSAIMSKKRVFRRLHMTRAMIKDLDRNRMYIQSHSYYHPLMHREDDRVNDTQFRLSKKWLEKLLNKKIEYFAYPFGSYTRKVMSLGVRNGYKGLFTINNSTNGIGTNPLAINRFMVLKRLSIKRFAFHVNARYLDVAGFDPIDGGVYKKITSIKIRVRNKLDLGKYTLRVLHNGHNIKGFKYDSTTGLIYYKTEGRLSRGLNNVFVVFKSKQRGLPSYTASWAFVNKAFGYRIVRKKHIIRRRALLIR